MSTPKLFSERIKKLRTDMGLGQSAFAKLLHVSRNYVSMLEGGRPPSAVLHAHFERLERDFALLSIHERVEAAEKLAELHGGTPAQKDAAFNRVVEAPHPHVTGARALLKEARLAKGMTPAQLAKATGYSLSVYQDIEDGLSRMGEKQAKKLAAVLGVDVSILMSGSDHPPEEGAVFGSFGTIPELRLPAGMTAKRVPLLAMAECGSMAWDDGAYTGEGVTVIDCEDPRAFAVKLSGDSMQPKYDPGDVAIVYPTFTPRNGDLVIARLDDAHGADVMFKIYQATADQVILGSYNPAYESMPYPRGAFQWIYVVDQVIKKVRNSRR